MNEREREKEREREREMLFHAATCLFVCVFLLFPDGVELVDGG